MRNTLPVSCQRSQKGQYRLLRFVIWRVRIKALMYKGCAKYFPVIGVKLISSQHSQFAQQVINVARGQGDICQPKLFCTNSIVTSLIFYLFQQSGMYCQCTQAVSLKSTFRSLDIAVHQISALTNCIPYIGNALSLVTSVSPSAWACAINIRSKGSS